MTRIDNVTIIIPAHNRPERLQRLLDYYAGSGARILVPDSSNEPFKGEIDKETTVYLHRPKMHFLDKIREVLPMIDTPYVLYCADDDFAVPEGIAEVTAFLDQNPDYVVAQGHYLTFCPKVDGSVSFTPRYIRYFDSRVTGETPLDRLTGEITQYASFLYGVVRSDVFIDMYAYCFDDRGVRRFSNLFLAEEFFCHATRIFGKYATVPCFFSARENIPGSATSTTVPASVIKNSPEYKDEYDGFVRALTLMLTDRQPELAENDAEAAVRRANASPVDSRQVVLKRKIIGALAKHKLLRPLVELANRRYFQKGLKAVAGMPSYPCKDETPEIKAILAAVRSTGV